MVEAERLMIRKPVPQSKSPFLFQPAVMHLACVNQRMSLTEALAAATINAAHSLGRAKTHGSIEVGKVADLVVVDAPK